MTDDASADVLPTSDEHSHPNRDAVASVGVPVSRR